MGFKLAEYDKNILKLFTGTAMAQLVSFLIIPLIAKLYGPAQYGIYAGFLGAVNIISILCTGKYEFAIMLAADEAEVNLLMDLSNWINLLICLIIAALAFLLPLNFLRSLFGLTSGDRLLFFLVPMGAYFLAAFQVFNYSLVRNKEFSSLSINKIIRSLVFGALALAIGYFAPQALFIALALVLSHLIANILLRLRIKELRLKPKLLLNEIEYTSFKNVAKKFKSFPTYILPAELINVVCAQLPIFIFLWNFNPQDSGYFSFILTLLNIPISLLAGAILDVFKEQASSDYRQLGNCRATYLTTLKKMFIVAVLPFIAIYLFGNTIISWLFGEQWLPAGKFLNILLGMFFFKFISSPLSFVFYIANKQKEDFLWHIYILVSTLLVLYFGAVYFKDILLTVKLYAINFSIIYIIYLVRSYQLSQPKIAA